MEKKKNEELQSRREFFKKAAKGALPILAAVVLAGAPAVIRAAEEEPMGCKYSCSGTCSGSCKNACQSTCKGTCSGSCKEYCTHTCSGTCSGSCRETCRHSSGK